MKQFDYSRGEVRNRQRPVKGDEAVCLRRMRPTALNQNFNNSGSTYMYMDGTRRSRQSGLALIIPTLAALTGCDQLGLEQDDPPPGDAYYKDEDDARLMGIEGVTFATTSYQTIDNKLTIIDHDGVTDAAGQFQMGSSREQVCTSGTNDKGEPETECNDTGPRRYGAFNFSICGRSLPQVYGPTTDTGWRPPTYTISDLSTDPLVVRNVAAVLLMANANSGDPTKTGIKIPSVLQQGQCDSIDWATTDIQQHAASWQAVAQRDGQSHPWPSEQAITDYLDQTYVCAQSGYHFGLQHDSAATPLQWGQFIVVADTQGQLQGYMDYSGRGVIEPFHEGRWFYGQLSAAAGGSTFSSVIPADTPTPGMPELQVNVSFAPEKPEGTWQSATAAGTTRGAVFGYPDGELMDRGLTAWAFEDFPKYRFIATNVTYTRPGGTAPETYVLEMEVSHNNQLSGGLRFWPPKRYDDSYDYASNALNWHGSMTGNTLTLIWYDNAKVTATKKEMKLTLDPATASLTGTLDGMDGGQFITFTNEQPLRGCRL